MNYGAIKYCDIANGTGVRVSLFVSGCRNHCPGCFQPETWSFSHGEPFTDETAEEIFSLSDKSYIAGLSLLGGDPFEPENQEVLEPFLREYRRRFPAKTVWAYTGYTLEELSDPSFRAHSAYTEGMLSMIDVLVDGRFVEELKDISLRFRGSSNQRLINLSETRKTGVLTLWGV